MTRTGAQLGSLPYTSPEQLERGADAIDARSDVYSLGVTLYELLTLRPAYAEVDTERLRRLVLDGSFAPIRVVNPRVPWDAETVCLAAMEREPARRYVSMAAFARDLRHVLANEPIEARRPGVLLRLRRRVQRRPAQSVAGLLGVLLLVVGPGVYGWQEHRRGVALAEANVRIDQQLRATQAANERAEREKEAAQRSETRAKNAARISRQARDRVPCESGRRAARVRAAGESVRKELLERAVKLYEQILAADPENTDVVLELAQNLRRLGNRCEEQGDSDAANRSLRTHARRARAAEGRAHDGPPLWRVLASTFGDRGISSARRAASNALDDLDQASALWRKVIEAIPDLDEARMNLASVLESSAYVLQRQERHEDALGVSEEAVKIAPDLVERHPTVARLRDSLAAHSFDPV
jgi:tetratricopeptide (TPR) repeat protein